MPQPMRSYKQADHLKRIIARVDNKTCHYAARYGASKCQHNSNENQQSDLAPAAPQLRGVQQAEKGSGGENSPHFSEAPRNYRVDVAAENRLLNQRGQKHGEQHEEKGGVAILKECLDRKVFLGREQRRSKRNYY